MSTNIIKKYVNKITREHVSAMQYKDIRDFKNLHKLIGDIYPTITPAHTRIYENNWVVRDSKGNVEFICCAHNEKCFENKYEIYK